MNKNLRTKYGTVRINNNGYYQITSCKEGNHKKLLHRLIAAEYFGEWINDPKEPFVIHHIDGNRLNNCVLNLEPIPRDEHSQLHHKCKKLSDEHKQKISESLKGKTGYWNGKKFSDEHKRKISESQNTTGYLNVSKHKDPTCKQGFIWRYRYYENGKRKDISSVSLEKLKEKVQAKGLKWRRI